MRSTLYRLSGMLVLAAGMLASCGGGQEAETLKFTVTFDSNGGSAVAKQTVEYNKTAKKPANPTKEGFTFDAWYADEACKVAFDFTTKITADWKLFANWISGGGDSSGGGDASSGSEQGQGFTMVFVDASWWNEAAAATTYTLNPKNADGNPSTTKANHGAWDETTRTNTWTVDVPATATSIQFFRMDGDGTQDWGARTVVIDLTARAGKTTWKLDGTAAWYGNGVKASGAWIS